MRSVLDDVARQLVRVSIEGAGGFISLPMLFPGGAPVVVQVRRDGDAYLVTDFGRAYSEAETLGATTVFVRIARKVAEAAGIEFDGHMMFAARVANDWLANAVIFVATASRNAVELAAERITSDMDETLRDRLKYALRETFRDRASFDVEVPGASTKTRHFTALVRNDSRITLFDVVTPSPVSVSFAIVKFQDVAQLEEAPSRMALLGGKVDAADQALLSQWAKVSAFNDNHDFLRRAA